MSPIADLGALPSPQLFVARSPTPGRTLPACDRRYSAPRYLRHRAGARHYADIECYGRRRHVRMACEVSVEKCRGLFRINMELAMGSEPTSEA